MNYTFDISDQFFHLEFAEPVAIMSSSVLNGGFCKALHFFNTKVDANFLGEKTEFEKPIVTLSNIARANNWEGEAVGMMTAALMTSFRRVKFEEQGIWIEVFLTSGVSNARRAGDKADYQFMNEACEKIGTINMIILTNASLSQYSMIECIMMATEAKSACLQDLNVKSPVSGKIATGTGTDSCAVASGAGPNVEYCGKHVLFGELLAKAVYQALKNSLEI
jgi:adenosylcobinamide amidohydrolase